MKRLVLALLLAATAFAAHAGARIEKLADGVYASIRTEPPATAYEEAKAGKRS